MPPPHMMHHPGRPMPPRPAPPKQPQIPVWRVWKRFEDEEGKEYYYNTITKHVQWRKPEGYLTVRDFVFIFVFLATVQCLNTRFQLFSKKSC
jgi:hypothetical protein